MFDRIEPDKTRTTELIYLGPDNLELINKFAATIIVVPNTGEPAALIHVGLAPIEDFTKREIHNVAMNKTQLDSIIADLLEVQRTMDNM